MLLTNAKKASVPRYICNSCHGEAAFYPSTNRLENKLSKLRAEEAKENHKVTQQDKRHDRSPPLFLLVVFTLFPEAMTPLRSIPEEPFQVPRTTISRYFDIPASN